MPEHTPLTDNQLDKIAANGPHSQQLVGEIREARRLLRAVEWTDCNLAVDEHKAVEAYLAACERKP